MKTREVMAVLGFKYYDQIHRYIRWGILKPIGFRPTPINKTQQSMIFDSEEIIRLYGFYKKPEVMEILGLKRWQYDDFVYKKKWLNASYKGKRRRLFTGDDIYQFAKFMAKGQFRWKHFKKQCRLVVNRIDRGRELIAQSLKDEPI